MGSMDKKIRVNFSGDGAALLRDRISEKLKEFMGDYTDDVLVEYVIVLLRNGRDKEEARNELNVFLGDDSDSFVSWLWDHLATNLDLYVQPQETHTDEVARTNPTLVEQTGGNESRHMDSEPQKVKPDNSYRGRHKREWKDERDVSHQPPLRSSVVVNIHQEKKTLCNVSRARRSPSPQSPQLKKRSQHDEQQHVKRDTVSQASSGAPRRLLQFAVRDAFRTLRPSGMVKEPSLKRLRSVVSTSTEVTSLVDRPRRLQSIARVPNPMATVLKAVQEAAGVVKVKSSRSVFDRLGRDMDASLITEQVTEFRDAAFEDDKYEELNAIQVQNHTNYPQRSKYCGHSGPMNMTEHEAGLTSDLMSDDEGYDDTNVVDHRVMNVSQTGTSYRSKAEDSLMSKYSGAKDQDKSVSAANTSLKIVNISVNVNAWRPPHYQEPRDAVMDNQKSVQNNEKNAGRFGAKLMKEVSKPVSVGNGNAKPAGDIHQEPQKPPSSASGSYTAGRPLEDADSRTIFVSNVHFAATKDSLSRHFNKFGEVLKVVIVSDAATGQPTGSAYVEFMRKEAADNGLSLDGTSFMSRILKVMKRSSSNQEANPIMTWPRITHCSPYAAGRFSRAAFPRGTPAAFRPQLHVKPGARSLQWKRDAQASPAESSAAVFGSSVVSPSARSLTYVRTEPKPDRNLGNA
ncbi:ZINC FINGER CCCH DOMAIN-CONTAINING PROTEIN 14 [Salix viminalis]|uniref:ZINC FINGER CCCH DOMAIN-CONTAINING PROTEIN 14 n=1 Tax=Salix viminalis TaxID=40686 RepID=A0A9Q0NJL0_SALVM|nr:ZINC FINGER CCCH DOMAIN-CONTAINING PROTEIN 14 [Salix viminalis]